MSKETAQPKSTKPLKEVEHPTIGDTPISETEHLNSTAANKAVLEESKKQADEGKLISPVEFKSTGALEEPKLSNEERVVKFLKEKGKGEFILLNDFLKSLYPVPKMGMKPAWLDRVESKKLKVLLTSLVASGQIEIEANRHTTLGGFYYDTQDPNQVTQYHNIATVQMRARSCQ